jgi:hypothetical protein
MPGLIDKPVPAGLRSHPIARQHTAEVANGDPSPCPNPACRAPGWPLVAKPRNWPWADQCWNCSVELR